MNENPLVSVIIPTYNRAWSLPAAIDSVLAQDYQPFELIVIDDGSSDNTPFLLSAYKHQIKTVRQENAGVSAARNTGIDTAAGDFLAFLDSDDRWLPQKLARQVDFFRRHPDALICQTEELWVRNGVRVNPKKRHQKRSGDIFVPSLSLCLVSPSAVMLKRKLLDEIGRFDENLPACEDYDLWLRVSARHPVYLLDDPLIIKHGGHPDQLSRAAGLDRFRIQALRKILQQGRLSTARQRAAVSVLQQKCAVYAAGCRKRQRFAEADAYLAIAQRYGPAPLSF